MAHVYNADAKRRTHMIEIAIKVSTVFAMILIGYIAC